jgi:chromosomal replication initiation ATPase DnaA
MSVDQIPLDLDYRPGLTRADFAVAAANAEAFTALEQWPDWPSATLILTGPEGSGKSHLANIWRTRTGAREIAPDNIAVPTVPALIEGARAIVIDDAHRAPEEALLHIFNMTAERCGHLLLVSRDPPVRWNIALPDLRSRLLASPSFTIAPPDDELLRAVLIKLFADRQLTVPREIISYLALHGERSYAGAIQAVTALDSAALAESRRITVALLKRVLPIDLKESENTTLSDPSA